jgi:hypothetical protein
MASGKFKAKFPMISHFARWQFTHIRFWYQHFSDAHEIGTLWARDLRFFLKMTIMDSSFMLLDF